MNSTARSGFQFQLEWRTTLVTLLLLPTMIGLGFWQLSRAEEKSRLLEDAQRQQAAPAVYLSETTTLPPAQLAYRPVIVVGRYLNERSFLLDNRSFKGAYGFEVITPVELSDGTMALVNRGWIAGDPARRALPNVDKVAGPVSLSATVYVPPGKAYVLDDSGPVCDTWPCIIQAVDIPALGAALNTADPMYPYMLRLDDGQRGAQTIDWQTVNVQPEKHTAYAWQWFAMALALAILYVLRSTNIQQMWRKQA